MTDRWIEERKPKKKTKEERIKKKERKERTDGWMDGLKKGSQNKIKKKGRTERNKQTNKQERKNVRISKFKQQSHKTCTLMKHWTEETRRRGLSLYHTPKKLSPLLLLLKSP